jgi:hypothetical protein
MNKTTKISCLIITVITATALSAQAASVVFDMGTLTTTGEDNTGWDGPGIANFYSGSSGRGEVAAPMWTVFTTAAIHGTSSGGDTLSAGDYTVTFDAAWAASPGSVVPNMTFEAFAWDGTTETALAVSSSYNLLAYNVWASYEYTFSVADGAAVLGQDLRLKFNQNSGGHIGVDTFEVAYSPVPEPASYALLGGFLALGYVMVRRR